MKLVVPFVHQIQLQVADDRLVNLADALGLECQLLPLPAGKPSLASAVEASSIDPGQSCLVLNPETLRAWQPLEAFPAEWDNYLCSRFKFIFVHNLQPSPYADRMLAVLSAGKLASVRPVQSPVLEYEIDSANKDVCGAFSGIRFGPVNPSNDSVLLGGSDGLRKFISIHGELFFASLANKTCEVFFLAGRNVADLSMNVETVPLADFFSQLVPVLMLLRYVFGQESWQPNALHGAVIIDDPLLRKTYGFLDYERLLGMMDSRNFHTSIAFIPFNFKRNSAAIVRMFKTRPDRYSICFHGNDHTGSELAAADTRLLNAMLTTAAARMDFHDSETGLQCDRVMVFPQGCFSEEAMQVLNAHNFSGAVNTTAHPQGKLATSAMRDLLYPSIWKYADFPLFLRKYPTEISPQDIAFCAFVGRPIFIVEHHQIFKDPQPLLEAIAQINSMLPQIRWTNLQTAAENSSLTRMTGDGIFHVRPASKSAWIQNPGPAPLRCSIEWPVYQLPPEKVLLDGEVLSDVHIEASRVRASCELAPGASRRLELVHNNEFGLSDANRKIKWRAKAFVRRRLSEFRDNFLCKHPALLRAAKILRPPAQYDSGS